MSAAMVDLVKQWKEAARRDDLFDHMVPSDVRQLVGEIERLRADLDAIPEDVKRHWHGIRAVRLCGGMP